MVCRLGADHDIAGAEVWVEASSDPGEEDVGWLELLDKQSSRHGCIHFSDPRVGQHNLSVFQAPGREPDPLHGHLRLVRKLLSQRLNFQGHCTEDGYNARSGELAGGYYPPGRRLLSNSAAGQKRKRKASCASVSYLVLFPSARKLLRSKRCGQVMPKQRGYPECPVLSEAKSSFSP